MQPHDRGWTIPRNQLAGKRSCPKCCLSRQLATTSCSLREWHEWKNNEVIWILTSQWKLGIFFGFVAVSPCVMAEGWHRVHFTAGLALVAVLCGGVIVCYAGIWWIRSLFEQLVVFQHALVNSREQRSSTSNSINEAARLMWFKRRVLPSGSECPQKTLRSVWLSPQSPPSGEREPARWGTKTKRYVKDEAQRLNPTNEAAHLVKPVKVILIDLELKAFLKASSLWHLHIHRTNVLLALILLLLPQAAKVTKWQFSRLVNNDRRQESCLAFYKRLFAQADFS